jgi:hypothetical protein
MSSSTLPVVSVISLAVIWPMISSGKVVPEALLAKRVPAHCLY